MSHPLRKTKIVATIGPACDGVDVLARMIEAGMNVARLNMSHEDHESHRRRLESVRQAGERVGVMVATMMDTKGAEIRTGTVAQGVVIRPGALFSLFAADILGDEAGVSISYPALVERLEPGTRVLIDDGHLELEVETVRPGELTCRVLRGGPLESHKGVNVPSVSLLLDGLNDANRADLAFAVDAGIDYIAASFMQSADDVTAIRDFLAEHGGEHIPIIAKIESTDGIVNLDAIIEVADGTMVARGDLGVEISAANVPVAQKRIIRHTVGAGKPVITATQMLDSMERNPEATRAEASDVVNAVLDGTSAVMLSGETARGRYPVEAVQSMAELASVAEASLREYGYLQQISAHPTARVTDAVSRAASEMANHLAARAILTLTESGFTSRQISKYRPRCPILAATRSPQVARRLALNWGVTAWLNEDAASDEEKLEHALTWASDRGYLRGGDTVVVTAGISSEAGSTSTIRVITVP
ncbi:MAG: pyruvate kinase [Deltaproteobacteria bacterium]|nr:pyruvate kinase [Deltaproteobacteria bacterium]MBW2394446.1 pyruvate kinase [Deltaproteobacteria bacterium]